MSRADVKLQPKSELMASNIIHHFILMLTPDLLTSNPHTITRNLFIEFHQFSQFQQQFGERKCLRNKSLVGGDEILLSSFLKQTFYCWKEMFRLTNMSMSHKLV